MFNWYKLAYAINIVEMRMKSQGVTPFEGFQSCLVEHDYVGKDLLKAGKGKYFAAAHQIVVTAAAYEMLTEQLSHLREPFPAMVSDLNQGAVAAFELVLEKEPEAIYAISPYCADPRELAAKWKAKSEFESKRLWERFQVSLATVIAADESLSEPTSAVAERYTDVSTVLVNQGDCEVGETVKEG